MTQILTDSLTRHLYANDASMYEELPAGVAFPEHLEDIVSLVRRAAAEGLSITARTAGTSLAGQTTGGGVIMDVSRHMNRILDLDPESGHAHVQPGVIRDTLNREAAPHALQFGPDTSTTNRCMIGGMIGNNSCGSFSIKHRTTREHVLEIEAVLSDGSVARFRPLSPEELEEVCHQQNLEGRIYREMLRLLREHRELIRTSYPHPEIIRRNTGYALDRLCEMDPITPGGRPFNLAELLCGSEGTLAMTASARVNLVPVDRYRLLVIPQFKDLLEAMRATVEAVKFDPAAVELADRIILDATKGNIEQKKNRFFLEGEPECILMIQFEGNDLEELRDRAASLVERLREKSFGYTWPVFEDESRINRVWDLRKAGLGLLMGLSQDSRSPTFVEDTAVRVEDLPEYVAEFRELLKRYDTTCVFYAHASVGELHLRPVLDITTRAGIEKMKAMAGEVADLVKKYRGSLSGEHGDGRARAPYIEKVLGSDMIPVLRKVKEIWDPQNRFNPGKILDPEPIDSNLRFNPDRPFEKPETVFHWESERGFRSAIEQCNGAGVCRKRAESGGTMCPSYHATLEEKDSTRGRANLFRQLFMQKGSEAFSSPEIHEALELCLSCKACKSECPANVDMAKMKAEFMNGWHRENGIPLASRFFGEPERFYPLASRMAPLANRLMAWAPVRYLLQEVVGVDARRRLPPFAEQTFRQWFDEQGERFRKGGRKRVALLVDPFVNCHEPEIATAACEVFDRLGYDVLIPNVEATGRPQISRGLLEKARKICEQNLSRLAGLVGEGIPIVGLEPSELLTLRDEYPDLCDPSMRPLARKVAGECLLFEEFLRREIDGNPDLASSFRPAGHKIALHGHCHTRALVGNEPLMELLGRCGFDVREIQSGCCGMAGSFGYQKKNYDVSMTIGSQSLFPDVRKTPEQGEVVCAPGFSCRHQISDGTGQTASHPATILERALVHRE